jgi:hypothetical protein
MIASTDRTPSMLVRLFLAWLAVLAAPTTHAGGEVDLYLFWSLHCPHCLEARPQIRHMADTHRWIRLHDHEISASKDNRELFAGMAQALGQEAQAVPTIFYCGRMETGWDDRPQAIAALLARLEACRSGNSPAAVAVDRLMVPVFGDIDPGTISLPLLTIVLAGLDAFNPCAFFVLLFLLSLMVHQAHRGRMLAIGMTFVAISGLMYFAFMAAWLNLFRIAGSLNWITGIAGAVALAIGGAGIKDFFALRRGISLSIPEAGKADIFRRGRAILAADNIAAMIAATVLLAVAANTYELLCTAGFPMVFTRVLTLREADAATQYLYLALYNTIYVLPLLAIVLAFVRTMGARRLSEREGRLLKLLSGLMMAGLGALLLVAPERLDDPLSALALMAGAVALTWLAARLTRT